MPTIEYLTTDTAGQAALLNAINDASRDIVHRGADLRGEIAGIMASVVAGEQTNLTVANTARKVDELCAKRRALLDLARPVGCIDGHVILAALGQRHYWSAEKGAV